MISSRGDGLIFIISQPRSGSTLLQRILAGHPDIHTVSEPWLMLHPLYALRAEGYCAEYNTIWARKAMLNFLRLLPGGEEEYFASLRQMYGSLYNSILRPSGARFFLDKTPRYYLIIPELFRTFPEAYYIILRRNPLAVLNSITNNRKPDHWLSLYEYRSDLRQAPRLLKEGLDILGERGIVVHYEQLIENPEKEILRICHSIGLELECVPQMIEYGEQDLPRWQFGDQNSLYQHTRPTQPKVEKWVQALSKPQAWRVANDYLHLLGAEMIEQIGYSYETLHQLLEMKRPHPTDLWFTVSLTSLLAKPIQKWQKGDTSLESFIIHIQEQGGVYNAAQDRKRITTLILDKIRKNPRRITTLIFSQIWRVSKQFLSALRTS